MKKGIKLVTIDKFQIILVVLIIISILSGLGIYIINKNVPSKIVDCYDKFGSKIVGEVCLEKQYDNTINIIKTVIYIICLCIIFFIIIIFFIPEE